MKSFWKLVAVSLIAGLGLGYSKFYFLSHLANDVYTPADKAWLIQYLGSAITIGPFVAFLFSGALAQALPKNRVMSVSALALLIVCSIGGALNWEHPEPWSYIILVGFILGIFNPARNASIPIAAEADKETTDRVNAWVNITYIAGLLIGVPLATGLYELNTAVSRLVLCAIFFLLFVSASFCWFKGDKTESTGIIRNARFIFKDSSLVMSKTGGLLFVSALIWGMAAALSLAVTAYAEEQRLGGAFLCSLMSVWATVGVIIGNILSPRFAHLRYLFSSVMGAGMTLLIASVPILIGWLSPGQAVSENRWIYGILSFQVGLVGMSFGFITNLMEAEFMRRVRIDRVEGTGGALLSAAVAVVSCLLGLLLGYVLDRNIISSATQFELMAVICTVITLLIIRTGLVYRGYSLTEGFLGASLRLLVKLRYKVEVRGIEKLKTHRGCLVLPNHPAEIDPVLVTLSSFPYMRLRPVVLERFYFSPGIYTMMQIIGAFPMPDMHFDAGHFKTLRVEKSLNEAARMLNQGENILIYPSGALMRSGFERIGANSGAFNLAKAAPGASIVLVRTKGLYGSLFSTVYHPERSPEFGAILLEGIKILIKNFIFFAPKRLVTVEFEAAPEELRSRKTALEFNRTLEDWYNAAGEEKPSLVPVSAFSKKLLPVPEKKKLTAGETASISPAIKQRVYGILSSLAGMKEAQINDESSLSDDLGLDSLKIAELLSVLDDEYQRKDIDAPQLSTVQSVMLAASGSLPGVKKDTHLEISSAWKTAEAKREVKLPAGDTVQELFLRNARLHASTPLFADDRSGILSYRTILTRAFLLAERIKQIPEKRVGILLPASAAATISTAAAYLAGKTPVMLNWTVGKRALESAISSSGISKIISSETFLDIVKDDLTFLENKLFDLDALRKELTLFEKIKAFLRTYLPESALLGKIFHNGSAGEEAVILFTSGSESEPKGVPLTHKNVLSSVRGVLKVLPLNGKDAVCAILPPFHSFGFTICSVLPLAAGLRTFYFPNPNDGPAIARRCERWGISVLVGAPSFLSGILKELTSVPELRFVVSGAERAPDSLKEKVAKLGCEFLEGYGITECSPVVSANRPGEEKSGVGRPLDEVQVRIIHPESGQVLPEEREGLIVISGDNVFSGYINSDRNPFITVEGKQWYNSGDLGFMKNGKLHISGRMKRFVKIGGEMISLPSVEDALENGYKAGEGAHFAVVAIEKNESRPELVLFTVLDTDLEAVNRAIKTAGLSNLARVSRIIKVAELPSLATGKADYRKLQEMAGAS